MGKNSEIVQSSFTRDNFNMVANEMNVLYRTGKATIKFDETQLLRKITCIL